MKTYTENHNRIPESTILAIENVLHMSEFPIQVLEVLEKVAENGQIISDKILDLLAGNLSLIDKEEEIISRSFKVLEFADRNQELSDKVFEIVEMARAGVVVDSNVANFEVALEFLERKTQTGKELPFNVFKALNGHLENLQTLSILTNVSTNRQRLPDFMILEMINVFNSEKNQEELVKIFFAIDNNGQNFQWILLDQLEKRLDKAENADETLLIFAYRAQKGEILSQTLIEKISDKFLTTTNQSLKENCLSAFVSTMQINKELSQEFAEKVLIKGLDDENEKILETCLKGFNCIRTQGLNQDSIKALIQKAEQSTCPNELKHEIKRLLDSQSLDQEQGTQLKMATLDPKQELKLFLILGISIKNGVNLKKHNFQQLEDLIKGPDTDFQACAIHLLLIYPNKNDILDNLIDSIATLMFSTSSIDLRDQCLALLRGIPEPDKKLSKQALFFIYSLYGSNEVLRFIGKKKDIPEGARLSDQIDSIPDSAMPWELTVLLKKIIDGMPDSVEPWELAIFLKKMVDSDGRFEMTEVILKRLVYFAESYQKRGDNTFLQEFALIFSRALFQGFQENKNIVEVIEKTIELKKIDLNIVQAYGKLIQSQNCNKLSKSLNSLAEFLLQREFEEEDLISLEIFSCIADAAILGDFCLKGLELMEKNINNPNSKIREKCFQGLQTRKNKGYKSERFEAYCDKLLQKLKALTGIQVDSEPDLVETLTSLEYWDLGKMKQTSPNHWIRELLLSDLFSRLKANEFEKLVLYKEWLETEQSLKSQGLDSNRVLKTLVKTHRLSLENIVEILKFLPKIDLNEAKSILLRSLNPFQELKQKWVISLLTDCLKSQNLTQKCIAWFASTISSKLATSLISKLFATISKAEKLTELMSLKNFVLENKIRSSDICLKNASIADLKRSLEIKLLDQRIQSAIDRDKLAKYLGHLLEKDWSFEKLMEIFKKIESNTAFEKKIKEEGLFQVLESLVYYEIPATAKLKVLGIFDFKVGEWMKKVNEIAIEIHFQANPQVKNHVDLVEELKRDNTENTSLQEFLKKNENLSDLIDQIQKTKLLTYVAKAGPEIANGEKAKILNWAKEVKLNPESWTNPEFSIKALKKINEANALHTGYLLTNAQILSCIVLLNANPDQGRLLQVGTGEGKSTIVSVIAIIHALKGKKVDIITSSPVLAERDAREKAGLYKMFDLTCLDNTDKSPYYKGPKTCYKQDIVYGDISQFQFDTLRDQYSLLGTLAGREDQVVIIDEVDSLLIDDSSNIARLSSPVSGLDLLQPFIHLLWHRLNLLQQRLKVVNGKSYLLSDQAAQTQKMKESFQNMEDLNEAASEIGDLEIFLKGQLEKYLRDDIFKNDKIPVPKNFKNVVQKQISKWIDNALRALMNQEDQQYIIQGGVIKPVAYDSTGVVQNATSWGDGLHQLIQRKHGLKMTSESWTTNFISNIGYLRKYGHNLFGVTATFGSKKAQKFLSKGNQLDLVKIPSLYKKRYLQMSTVVCKNLSEWLQEICESTLREANKDRGVLIICQTIEHCKLIGYELGKRHRRGVIKLYTMNNMNQEKDIEEIHPGGIIVATNLAGRGTDIKTPKIEKNGGLHVIVTFLPCNQRVEDQAFGRTARQRNCGTGQMILNQSTLFEPGNASSQKLKEMRDNFESLMLDEVMEKELEIVTTKDKLFTEFCNLKKNLCQKIRKKTSFHQKNPYFGSSVYEASILNALEERWAFFLQRIDNEKAENEIIQLEESQAAYECFKNEILQDFEKDKLIKNPYYHIIIANDRLVCNSLFQRYIISLLEDRNTQAANHFDEAINLDSNVSAAAFAGKAWLAIKCQKKGDSKKTQFIQEFKNSLKCLHDEMAVLNTVQVLLQQEYPNRECDLSKQLNQKASILGSYMNSIKHAVTVIKQSQRLIDITGIKLYQKDTINTKGEFLNKKEDYDPEKLKVTSSFFGLERNPQTKEIEQKIEEHSHFTLVFNDLTMYVDSVSKDQAIETISEAFESHNDTSDTKLNNLLQKTKNLFKNCPVLDKLDYKDLALTLEKLDTEKLKSLLDPNVQIPDISRDFAIAQLKKQSQNCLVDLVSIVDGQETKSRINLKVQDAINILEANECEQERFSILLKNINKTAKYLQKGILKHCVLTMEYSNLNVENAKSKLDKIKFKNLYLEISGNKSEILEALKDEKIEAVQFTSENNGTETVYIEKARERIEKMKSQQVQIKIEELGRGTAKRILSVCPSASFQVTFIEVDPSLIPIDSEEEPINVSFSKLSPYIAKKLIPILREANMNFTLAFHNLNLQQLKDVIKKASLQQEAIEITKEKKLGELFMNNVRPHLELSEFAARGIEYLLEVNEKKFMPWLSIAIIAFVGILQIIAGVYLMASALNASLGMALITETVTEVITICQTFRNRHFRWSDYLKQKTVSLIISAVSLGIAKYQVGTKEFNIVSQGVKREAVEQVATETVRNSEAFFRTLGLAYQKIKQLTVQQWATSAPSIGIATEVLKKINKGVDYLFQFSFEKYKPEISSFIQEKVENMFYAKSLKIIIQKMHALDRIRNSKSLPSEISKIVENIVNPQKNMSQELWDSIGLRLCRAIFWNSTKGKGYFSTGMRILDTLTSLNDIRKLLDSIESRLMKKLSEKDKETCQFYQLLHQHRHIPLDQAREISRILREDGVILKDLDCEYINPEMFQKQPDRNQEHDLQQNIIKRTRNYSQDRVRKNVQNINFGYLDKHKKDVLEFCEDLHKYSSMIDSNDLNEIMKPISDIITDQVIRIAESHLISSGSGLHIQNPINKHSEKVQSDLNPNPSENELNFAVGCFQGLEAREVHSQLENQNDEQEKQDIEVKESNLDLLLGEKIMNYINQIQESKTAGLADILSLVSLYEIKLKIVENIDYVLTEEEINQGVKIVFCTPDGKTEEEEEARVKYYQLLNPNRAVRETSNLGNGCGFAVISMILKEEGRNISVRELRKQLIENIKQDPLNYLKLIEAQDWVRNSDLKEITKTFF